MGSSPVPTPEPVPAVRAAKPSEDSPGVRKAPSSPTVDFAGGVACDYAVLWGLAAALFVAFCVYGTKRGKPGR